ncbi:MAG: PilW family protein [Pseudomonas sp.]
MKRRVSRVHAGFGLIELMIAMALGLLVLGAAIAIFQSNQRTFQANQGLNRIQENARVAYELMSRDIRAAGGSACSNLAMPDVEHANTADENAFLTSPVSGSGTEFTVVSGDDASYEISGATTTSLTLKAGQIDDANDAFKINDKLILCNASQLYVVTATNVTTQTITFTPATPVVFTNDPRAPPATVMVARFRNTRWYLDNGSLYVRRNGDAQPVIDGVSSLGVTYLRDGLNTYTATPAQWNDVTAVRVNLTLSGRNVDGGALTRDISNVISLRSRTP